jgi:glutathione S-transferase
MAFYESETQFESNYISMPDGDHLTPNMAKNNPKMTLPAVVDQQGQWICDSREIVDHLLPDGGDN